ncbi:hypothetical protein [Pelosinus sp. sgz500959]|uniref:hypothetical protein n=1 Tax=Pelosinus sp. sgz500959 TaxID=3242472 RepID=UPI0036717801
MNDYVFIATKYLRGIVIFDNANDLNRFFDEVEDSKKIYEPKDGDMLQMYIAGIALPSNQEDTPEDAYASIRKVREWVESFRQAQDQ